MNQTDNVESEIDEVEVQQEPQEQAEEQIQEHVETQVPLSALKKERKRAQEAELKLKWLQEQQQKAVQQHPQEDESQYESATKADLLKMQHSAQEAAIRDIEERMWIRQNPEKNEELTQYLEPFLQQNPHLVAAINAKTNRYEEAYKLMEALSPKKQIQMKNPVVKKEAPNAPGGIPKNSNLNAAVDLFNMSDAEYNAWRKSQKRGR